MKMFPKMGCASFAGLFEPSFCCIRECFMAEMLLVFSQDLAPGSFFCLQFVAVQDVQEKVLCSVTKEVSL